MYTKYSCNATAGRRYGELIADVFHHQYPPDLLRPVWNALYATKQRTKEIGIRKVNGASTRSIMLLLIRQFVKWIAVAFVIATPLAWVLLNRWLESFANRISISPLYFLMGGGIVLAITLLTVGWHSYRAASSNPVKSLKSE